MTQTIWIALIIAISTIVILYIFRRQLKDFALRLNRNELSAELHTHDPASVGTPTPQSTSTPSTSSGVKITGSKMFGRRHRINVARDNAEISDSLMVGRDHTIAATTPDPRIVHLPQYITNNFSLNDLRTLSQHLHLNYDTLAGGTIEAKARALLDRAQQQQQIPQLIDAGRQLHPELPWESA